MNIWQAEPELVQELSALWLDGLSASQIARKLGRGLTRNAIIGKVYRLGLENPTMKTNTPRSPRERKLPKCAPLPIPVPPPPEAPPSLNLDIEQLTAATCRYPLGTEAPYSYCGHEPKPGAFIVPSIALWPTSPSSHTSASYEDWQQRLAPVGSPMLDPPLR